MKVSVYLFLILLVAALHSCDNDEGNDVDGYQLHDILTEEGIYVEYVPSDTILFDHSIHGKLFEQGFNCIFCHTTNSFSRTPEKVDLNFCKSCHQFSIDLDINAVVNKKGLNWNLVKQLDTSFLNITIPFSHKLHVKTAGIDCKQCHKDDGSKLNISNCVECHYRNQDASLNLYDSIKNQF